MKHFLSLSIILTTFLISGCSTDFIAKYDNKDEMFIGQIDGSYTVTSNLKLTGNESGTVCTGKSYVTHMPVWSCKGGTGEINVSCNDGKIIRGNWVSKDCIEGYGIGKDQFGNVVKFYFGYGVIEKTLAMYGKNNLPNNYQDNNKSKNVIGKGTGFFVSTQGHFLTNYHVIQNASAVEIVTTDGNRFPAKIIRIDPANDLALCQAEYKDSKPITINADVEYEKGQEVLTLGYPISELQGQEQKATFGRINSLSGLYDDVRYLQVDVPVQPGNSGGPLINKNGELIGIITATLDQRKVLKASGSFAQNVNYATKFDYAIPLIKNYIHIQDKKGTNSQYDYPTIIKNYTSSVIQVISR